MNSSPRETTTMLHPLARFLGTAAFAALMAATAPAFASDGVIELNQAKIVAAGGYPFPPERTGW
jgi:hypothetical protein